MASASTKAGHGIAKVLGIKVANQKDADNITRGESAFSGATNVDSHIERDPTTAEYLSRFRPTGQGVKHYFVELFPFLKWIAHYNTTWLLGDLIAGLTVGAVVVPQGMAYALLAKLPPEYGLYTSFVGFLLYWAFATSKDITIGTVAVMSTLVGNVVISVQDEHPEIPAEEIARCLALISGCIVLFIGLARIGWIVEWISLTAITAFMTGSAISIGVGQIPALLGITGVNNREAAYLVFINTLRALPRAKIDAAMGLTALFMLYFIRYAFTFLSERHPSKKKLYFFLSTLRIAFVLLLYILISWLVNRHVTDSKKARFRILGTIPRGFRHAGAPVIRTTTISAFVGDLPAVVIVLLIEHIAISKSFGRINNYTINPSQELVAIGFSNVFGPFLGAYPATGSFSRTAIKSKAGVRTPLAGVFTAILVLLALYALTSVFFYIPMSSLAAVIIHAVGDLITPPKVVYQFWEVSPLEVPIFFLGVFITIFTNIENGIYATIAASAALMLYRLSKANGRFLGKTKIHTVVRNSVNEKGQDTTASSTNSNPDAHSPSTRDVFLPIDHHDGLNSEVHVESPHPGVYIYKFSEGFNYPNSQHYMEHFTEFIFAHTRRTTTDNYAKLGDRPWNDPGPRRGQTAPVVSHRPTLRAIILDFGAVNNVDVSAVQNLVDVRNQLDRYAAPDVVRWHFANVQNRWTKRALASAGFGYATPGTAKGKWVSIVADVETEREPEYLNEKAVDVESHRVGDEITQHPSTDDSFNGIEKVGGGGGVVKTVPLYGVNRPFFHVDVQAALDSELAY